MLKQKYIRDVLNKLYEMYPDAHCELNHSTPFELLIATVLSAQTTDKKVNQVTEKLFKEYKTPQDFLKLSQEELEIKIKEIGLYKSKAKNILGLCEALITNFNGEVPKTIDELVTLPGAGKKTANVVVSNAFNIPALAVDTHVFRVSNRIGLADGKNVVEVEEQLMKKIPEEEWIIAHHTLIFHGRRICVARNPKCSECAINYTCKFFLKNEKEKSKIN